MAVLTFGYQSYAQSTLWVGYQGWSGGSENIYGYDTTGGTMTLSATLALTSDFTGSVQGVHGMSLHPTTGEMYVNYQQSGGTGSRRLGTVDLSTGDITDIGLLGDPDITDICFMGDVLYGTGGQCGGAKELYVIDITDASVTSPGSFSTGSCSDHSLLWNYYTEEIYRHSTGTSNITSIGVSDASESASLGTTATWTHAMAMKNDSVIYVSDGASIDEFNMNTGVTSPSVVSTSGTVHSMAFDSYPLFIVVNGPSVFCANDSSLLTTSETGSTYQWFLDGAPITDATDESWYPAESGVYTCDVDGTLSTQTSITVLPIPEASFTTTSPIDLGVDATGTVDFTNTSTGGSGGFYWDFDNGFTSATENPSFSFNTVGTYDITLIVTDTSNGCMDTAWVTVEIINSTGINELSSDFTIYPTPTNDFVTVSMTNGSGEYAVSLVSLSGQEIMTQRLQSSTNSTKLDLSGIESGVYLVKIHNEEEQAFFKVIKQ